MYYGANCQQSKYEKLDQMSQFIDIIEAELKGWQLGYGRTIKYQSGKQDQRQLISGEISQLCFPFQIW